MKQKILSLLPWDHPWQKHIHWFDTADSTNLRLRAMAMEGAPQGTVVLAGAQTAGRGRLGRSFQSPVGQGVYLSLLLRPECSPEKLMHLTCAAAVAACDAVEEATGLRPGIKWTNDLVHGKRKLGGILTELLQTPQGLCAIIGIGINCGQTTGDFDPDIRGFAGSLAMATGREVAVEAVAAALITALEEMERTLLSGREAMLARYRRDCVTLGADICLLRGDTVRYGHGEDIDGSGALIVRFPDGHREEISSGEVSIRGMYGYI